MQPAPPGLNSAPHDGAQSGPPSCLKRPYIRDQKALRAFRACWLTKGLSDPIGRERNTAICTVPYSSALPTVDAARLPHVVSVLEIPLRVRLHSFIVRARQVEFCPRTSTSLETELPLKAGPNHCPVTALAPNQSLGAGPQLDLRTHKCDRAIRPVRDEQWQSAHYAYEMPRNELVCPI